jgi:hypothetical protein
MAGETEEPDGAAARLEAALERIAAVAAQRASAPPASPVEAQGVNAETSLDPEITARLDGLIERLRGALAVRPG